MTADAERRNIGRTLAVPMIGLGAACCTSVEFVKLNWPEFAAFPGAAGSLCAMVGVLLLFRSQLHAARMEREKKDHCIRISPYVPEMADGSNGAETLKIVLTPSPLVVVPDALPRDEQRDGTAGSPDTGTVASGPLHPSRSPRLVSRPLEPAQRIGAEWTQEVKLSGRAQERLDADPFVRRLARLG